MIILLAALTTVGNAIPAPRVTRDVQARVTIIRGREISAKTWSKAWKSSSQPAQREIIRIEKDGRPTLIRLTEFE